MSVKAVPMPAGPLPTMTTSYMSMKSLPGVIGKVLPFQPIIPIVGCLVNPLSGRPALHRACIHGITPK